MEKVSNAEYVQEPVVFWPRTSYLALHPDRVLYQKMIFPRMQLFERGARQTAQTSQAQWTLGARYERHGFEKSGKETV